ncbi:MAG: hypothetical protein KatS3mg057_2094 [Herpetosiphonaceae bacterium]|nr:MAG: hypothetical protein KatS3mg057_2094 [Herpetosiphonaceae bacterium]
MSYFVVRQKDPLTAFSFYLELLGMPKEEFREVSGLGSDQPTIDMVLPLPRGLSVRVKAPGRAKFQDITFKRPVTDSTTLATWYLLASSGGIDLARKSGSIVLYGQDGTERARWNFFNAWPTKYSQSSLIATANEVAIEELTITYEYLLRVR